MPQNWGTRVTVAYGEGDVNDAPRVVESEVRVRYAETDAEGVVYYANYLVYMEVGRVDFLRALGIDRRQLDRSDIGLVIVEASCRYRAPARFDDLLVVRTWVQDVRRATFTFVYEILNGEDEHLLATGRTVQVFADLRTMRSTRLPPEIRGALCHASAPPSR